MLEMATNTNSVIFQRLLLWIGTLVLISWQNYAYCISDAAFMNEKTNCNKVLTDIVLLIDSSGSIKNSEWEGNMKPFLSHLVSQLDIGYHKNHIGIVQFSSVASLLTDINGGLLNKSGYMITNGNWDGRFIRGDHPYSIDVPYVPSVAALHPTDYKGKFFLPPYATSFSPDTIAREVQTTSYIRRVIDTMVHQSKGTNTMDAVSIAREQLESSNRVNTSRKLLIILTDGNPSHPPYHPHQLNTAVQRDIDIMRTSWGEELKIAVVMVTRDLIYNKFKYAVVNFLNAMRVCNESPIDAYRNSCVGLYAANMNDLTNIYKDIKKYEICNIPKPKPNLPVPSTVLPPFKPIPKNPPKVIPRGPNRPSNPIVPGYPPSASTPPTPGSPTITSTTSTTTESSGGGSPIWRIAGASVGAIAVVSAVAGGAYYLTQRGRREYDSQFSQVDSFDREQSYEELEQHVETEEADFQE